MKQIFTHTLKFWPIYSLLTVVIGFYISFMIFKARAETSIEDTESLKTDVISLQREGALMRADVVNIRTDVGEIKSGVKDLTDYLIRKK